MLDALDGYDWREAFEYANIVERALPGDDVSRDSFTREDVVHIEALVEGENDEAPWYCVGRLVDGRWFALRAWCDYTGWDCQAGGEASVANDKETLLKFGLDSTEKELLGLAG